MSSGRSLTLLALGAVLMLSPGCAVDRSFFQMDSNSGVPFFGFDLIPRRKVGAVVPSSQPLSPPPIMRAQNP